jgi:hypothetical protein
MKDKIKIFGSSLIFLMYCFDPSPAISQHVLTVRDDLPSISTTYSEVFRFVEGLEDLVRRSKKPKEDLFLNKNIPITYEFGSTDLKIAHNSIRDLLNDPRLPNPAYTFKIIKTGFNDTISFQVYFQENFSYYELTGSDAGLVEAIQKHIDAFSHKNQSFRGSMPSRVLFSGFVGLVFLIIPALGSAFIAHHWPKLLGISGTLRSPISNYPRLNFLFLSSGLLSVGTGFYLIFSTTNTWFSKTKIYLNSASTLHMYSVEIGVIIGISSIIISGLFWFFPRQKNHPVQNEDVPIELAADDQGITGSPNPEKSPSVQHNKFS